MLILFVICVLYITWLTMRYYVRSNCLKHLCTSTNTVDNIKSTNAKHKTQNTEYFVCAVCDHHDHSKWKLLLAPKEKRKYHLKSDRSLLRKRSENGFANLWWISVLLFSRIKMKDKSLHALHNCKIVKWDKVTEINVVS